VLSKIPLRYARASSAKNMAPPVTALSVFLVRQIAMISVRDCMTPLDVTDISSGFSRLCATLAVRVNDEDLGLRRSLYGLLIRRIAISWPPVADGPAERDAGLEPIVTKGPPEAKAVAVDLSGEIEGVHAISSDIGCSRHARAAPKYCNAAEPTPTGAGTTAGMATDSATSPSTACFSLEDRQDTAEHDQDRQTKGTPHGQTPSDR
jgi:hypothetical protein